MKRQFGLVAAVAALVALSWIGAQGRASAGPAAIPVMAEGCTGDVNGDGVVSLADLLLVGSRLGTRAGDRRYEPRYDLNSDGRITAADVLIVWEHLGTRCGTGSTTTPTATRTASATATRTNTPAPTGTTTATRTATASATSTRTASPTVTQTTVPTATVTATATNTRTATATATTTTTRTVTPTATSTSQPTATSTTTATATPRTGLPPDPSDVAPAVDQTLATDIFGSTAFLYEGADPIQTGVAPGTIELKRVAILRGNVFDRDGQPISGVRISVLGHTELGETVTRADGAFDLAVNGGGELTIRYEKAGLLPAQRTVDAPWRDFAWLPDVVLVPLDTAVTTITSGAGAMQTARGSEVTDGDGTRQATVLFPAGTTASMVLPNGSTQPLSTLNIRATEFTVGDSGPAAMPAELPPSSGYTYAVELSIDEAMAAGSERVNFSQALPVYVENFVGFPVGGAVPAGYYDREAGRWVPSANGRVVEIVSITGGMADLDIDGDAVADDASSLGVTGAERTRLATLYTAGTELWRVPITHFSPWDLNWPYGPPSDAIQPPTDSPRDDGPRVETPSTDCGSVIGCESQTLGESVPIAGSPMTLHYQSDRTLGRRDRSRLDIAVSDSDAIPPTLLKMRVEVEIGGRLYKQSFAPAPDVSWTFFWDGKDAYGRQVQGSRTATVTVLYDYQPQYYPMGGADALFAFMRPGFGGLPGMLAARSTGVITAKQSWTKVLGTWDARGAGFGGWTFSEHHAYDPTNRVMLFGDGRQRSGDSLSTIVTNIAGTGTSGSSGEGDGGPATAAPLQNAGGVVVAPDGSVYFSDSDRVRRVGTDGIIANFAGSKECGYVGCSNGDGGPATAAHLNPGGLALGPDGSLYIVDCEVNSQCRIRRVGPDGIITTFAGNGTYNFCGDGGPATSACLAEPMDVAVGPDGSVYIADFRSYRIRRVTSDGIITTFAGNGAPCNFGTCGEGGPATAANVQPYGVAVGADGSVYISDGFTRGVGGSARIRRVTPEGVIESVAGGGTYSPPGHGEGGPALAAWLNGPGGLAVENDGSVYFADDRRIKFVSPDGILTTVAGNGAYPFGDPSFNPDGNGGPALAVSLTPSDVALAPDRTLVITDPGSYRVRRVGPALPDISVSDVLLPSEDGRELYLFNYAGRHLRTLDALTGAVLLEFAYDGDGYLTSITDGNGNVTTAERSGPAATAIVAPGGQRTELSLNGDGWLSRVANPLNEASTMSYHSSTGLLATLTDPIGNVHSYEYDTLGRLTFDDDPAGGSKTLARTELPEGYEVTTTSALGRARTYRVERLGTGQIRRTTIDTTGVATVSIIRAGFSEQTTFPGGASASLTYGPDPRWRMLAPVANLTATTPAGRTRVITNARTATLADPANLFSLTHLTETATDNGNTRTRVYDAATRTFTMTSAEGRTSTMTLDALGRMVSYQAAPGVDPIVDTYDAQGRLVLETQGALTQSFGYDARHRMTSSTDAGTFVTLYEYDDADRLTAATTPGNARYEFAHDANGNVTSVKMPNGSVHGFDYTALNQEDSYTPPGSSSAADWTYDADRAWTDTALPSARTLSASYEANGRPADRDYPEAHITLGYADATYRMSSMTREPITGIAQTMAMTYDGNLPLTVAASGAATGTYTYGYDNRHSLSSMNLVSGPGSANIALVRDRDGLITSYGPFTIGHTGPAGAANSIADGALSITNTYDTLGRLSQRRHVVAGITAYQLNLTYDSAGRIGERTETTAAGAETRVYTYDSDGQLTQVSVSGAPVESYSYDANGNRSSAAAPATYDAQDRVTDLGGVTYTHDADGYLATRGADTFQYSARGELLSATVGGSTVTYMYDALGRRVSRSDTNGTTQYLYGNPASNLQLTASIDPSGVLTVYYYHGNALFALERGGTRYYIASDNAGSPRVVSDASGAVVKEMQFDAYGRPLADTDPSFALAIGYAGGLADSTTGLVHFGFRDYDPSAGQWTSRDPALFGGGSLNLYAYVDGDPVGSIDPTGLWSVTVGGSLYELVGGGASLTIGSDGFKVCGEAGAGVGGGLEVGFSPTQGVGDTSLTASLVTEASAKLGVAKISAGYELSQRYGDPCIKGSGKVGVGVALPFLTDAPEVSANFDANGLKDTKAKLSPTSGEPGSSINKGGVGISAKVAAKACVGGNW